jgi:4-amino-4-deoxy-L-arabinose transferase-like glycosyltransferase
MNRPTSIRWIAAVVLITLWAFAVIGAYFVFHKPFGAQNVAAAASTMLDIWVAAAIVSIAISVGSRVVPDGNDVSSLEKCVLGAGAGLGFLSLILFALGLAGAYYRWLAWILLLAGLLLSSRRTLTLARQIRAGRIDWPADGFGRFLFLFLGGLLLMAFVQALLPPTAWDSLAYHLTGPKLYVQNHGVILPDVNIPYLGFPSLVEMLFTAGLLLKGPVVAQLLNWSFSVLTLAAIYVFALRRFDVRVAWLSMALFYSAPTIVLLSTWAYVDIALMFYALAAVHAVLRWRESRSVRWLLLGAVFCGSAMSSKYTAASLAVALLVLILSEGRARGWRRVFADSVFFGAAASLVVTPWLIKNWIMLGNPVYPFVFEGVHWDAFRRFWISRPGTGLAFTSPWRLLTAPWDMAVVATEGKAGFSATIGPLLLLGLPMLAFVWRGVEGGVRRALAALLTVCAVQYLIWLFGIAVSGMVIQTRLLFPIFPLLALMAGCALEHVRLLRRPAFAIDWILRALIVIVLSLNLAGAGLETVSSAPLQYLTGLESRDSYLARRLGPHYSVMDFINRNLSDSARIFFLWEPRSYYCQRQCQPDIILDGFKHLMYRFKTAPAIAAFLRDEGYTHVLLFDQGLDFVLADKGDPIDAVDVATLHELEQQYLQPVYGEGGPYVLYRLIER